jgi:hypothetical protein
MYLYKSDAIYYHCCRSLTDQPSATNITSEANTPPYCHVTTRKICYYAPPSLRPLDMVQTLLQVLILLSYSIRNSHFLFENLHAVVGQCSLV